jgi:hypothetical protein
VRCAVAAVALALVLAGCGGGGESKPPASQTNPNPNAGPPQRPNADPEPVGALSRAEYRAIVREYRKMRPLTQGADNPSLLDQGRRACAELVEPKTQLVGRVQKDCENAISFFIALDALERVRDDCTAVSQSDQLQCARDRYSAMADAIRATRKGAAAINVELARRGITGLCARSIGITQQQLDAYRQAEQAARAGVDAIAAADSVALDKATRELENELSSGATQDPLVGIERGCRTSKPSPLPRVPGGGGIQA